MTKQEQLSLVEEITNVNAPYDRVHSSKKMKRLLTGVINTPVDNSLHLATLNMIKVMMSGGNPTEEAQQAFAQYQTKISQALSQ